MLLNHNFVKYIQNYWFVNDSIVKFITFDKLIFCKNLRI